MRQAEVVAFVEAHHEVARVDVGHVEVLADARSMASRPLAHWTS
jgi:hypothetical protein